MKAVHAAKRIPGSLLRSWFMLTPEEQRVLILILVLLAIGLVARHWHLRRQAAAPEPSAPRVTHSRQTHAPG